MRLFERVVVKQELSPVLGSAIGPDQFAFKEGCNTTLALLTCHHHWLKWLDGAMDFVRGFSFDFSKAFDSVPYAIVCNKLMSLNMNPYVINWIVSFLSNRKQRIVVDGFVTEFVSINRGVPQGTVLGQISFSIMVNDIRNMFFYSILLFSIMVNDIRPDSAVTTGKHRAQEIDRETALQTSQNEETDRIPFTLTYHPQNLAIKNVILKNFKILSNDPETKHIFSLPPLISFKRDKNLGNFFVRSAFKFNNKPGTFTCKRTRCKTCPFISNTVNISGPNRSVKVTDHFTCISSNVIYCITCTLCKKIYIGETGRRLTDRFREHLRDAEPAKQHRCVQTSRAPFQSS